ncbi:MAG: S-layer homology domain-containing protein [Clostridia bacterium]|nr:S-layer homology domain-containing protein [Clostridia bacterium]
MKKRIIAIISAFMLLTQQVHASVLGSVITSWSHEIANGTEFYKNTFMSEQSGVGKQAEYYAEYTPNENVIPTVVTGQKIWGLKTIKQAEQYMKDNDMVPLIGINASYFSWQTGVPMGHVISDGRIISKDTETYQSIGFLENGKAFISPLSIETTLKSGETVIDIAHINKYNQDITDVVNLYTSDFDENNHTNYPSLNLILGEIDGNLGIDDELTAVVEEKFNYTGSIKIPSDKIVLTINESGKTELLDALSSLNVGDEITISSKALGSDDWKDAVSGLGSVGDTLVKDGEVQSGFASGAAPRTAVGITESGNVIFYVIDGRQQPYSYGVQIKTLANRMKELGCIDAINLDGGGSTAISGIYPGTDENAVLNSPSEGKLRTCSNYIFLKNAQQPTDELGHLYLYPFEQHYLSGYSEELYPAAADTAYYKMNLPDGLEFSVDGTQSSITPDGVLTAVGNGEFTVDVTDGNITGSAKYTTYETPTNINVYNAETNKEIKSLNLKKDDVIKLNLTAQHYYIDLKTSANCFEFEVTNDLGCITENNELVITSDGGEGFLKVMAGEYVKEIPLNVEFEIPFKDVAEHWAKDMIKALYQKNIISGYEEEDGLYFKPDNSMTREEFAVIVCNFLGIDTEEYVDFDLSEYADYDKISKWALPYVAAVTDRLLVSGKLEGEDVYFAPSDILSRAEAITVFGRLIASAKQEISFADSDEIPDWAAQYVSAMVSMGFVNGYEDNTIRPNGKVARAEAATMIYKMINSDIFPNEESVL